MRLVKKSPEILTPLRYAQMTALDTAKSAIGYMRTSSATNVGADKDSEKRQRAAIERYAARAGYIIVDWFNDAAVSGADPIDARPGFLAALERIKGNGVRVIIVETAGRFARDLMVQEIGYQRLKADGITLIAADRPESFTDDSPMADAFRQMMGVFAQLDKAMTVAKLRGARERKRRLTGRKVEGRRSHAETNPELVALAREFSASGLSLRQVAKALADKGYRRKNGEPYNPASIASMIA
jgi:DNA invertase Pin-like site-specific DNA recombinase